MIQSITAWRPDTPSLLLGFLLGVGLVFLFLRLLPRLRQQFQRARGWMQARISWMRSGVEVRFQSETAVYAQNYHLGADWSTLDQVFIAPYLTAPLEDDAILSEQRGAVQLAWLWPELAGQVGAPVLPLTTVEHLLRNGRRTLICGAPGAGKSTLLAYLTYRLATAAATPSGPDKTFAEVIPVFLHLAEMDWSAPTPEGETADPLTPLINALQKRSNPLTAPGIGDLLRRKAAAAQIVLLLDGWAELSAAQQMVVVTWMRSFLAAHSKTCVFVTAALDGYGELLPLGFSRTVIQPWRIGQAQSFMARWVEKLALTAVPPLDAIWQPGQTALETSLRFWLAAISGTEPTTRRADWLPASLSLFKPRKKGEPFTPLPDDILAFWQEAAYRLLNSGQLVMSADRVLALATAAARLAARPKEAPAAELPNGEIAPGTAPEVDKAQVSRLRKSLAQSAIFVRWGGGQMGIRSTVLRDYLAAAYLARQGSGGLEEYLVDAQWQHVWRHFATLADPAEAADHWLKVGDNDPARDGWFRVAAWLPHTRATGNWRRQVMINLGQLARQADQQPVMRLRAMAAMTLTGEEGLMKFVEQLLGRPDPFMRQMGTAVLPAIPDDKVVGMLTERLADEDMVVRLTAVYGLALRQYDPLAERPLVQALIGDNEEIGLLMAELLAYNGGPGLEILQEAVKEEDIQVRRAAVHGLSLLDDGWVETLLLDLERNDGEWFVRTAASGGLDTIRRRRLPQPWRPVRAADQPWLEGLMLAQGKRVPSGAAAVTLVTALFTDVPDVETRLLAARLLAQLPAKEAMPALLAAAQDGNVDTAVRMAAFEAWCALHRAYKE
jgi:HEAT repeat protein/energy-coupling factor transporter ATP-binding protein EcfA2